MGEPKYQPIGEGVFITDDEWIKCGFIANGAFTDGLKVSVNKKTKEMILSKITHENDGTKKEKIEYFSEQGVKSDFYQNGVRVGDINKRLNCLKANEDWLSLRPNENGYFHQGKHGMVYFGEMNA